MISQVHSNFDIVRFFFHRFYLRTARLRLQDREWVWAEWRWQRAFCLLGKWFLGLWTLGYLTRKISTKFAAEWVNFRILLWSFLFRFFGPQAWVGLMVLEPWSQKSWTRSSHRNCEHPPFWTEGPKGLCFSLALLHETFREYCVREHTSAFLSSFV